MAQPITSNIPGYGNWLPNGPMNLKQAKKILQDNGESIMPYPSLTSLNIYKPKNTIKIQLTEDEMSYLSKKLYNQLRAVVRETGEELIRQSILRDYNFKLDEQDLFWQTEINSEEKFKIKFELVCQVGDIVKVISLKKKKDVKRKRFLLM